MNNVLGLVKDLHDVFRLPCEACPTIPAKGITSLRLKLLKEEVGELEDAIAHDDIVEVADALVDIQYVLAGAILEFGMSEKFMTMFREVHRSNMSKPCSTLDEAKFSAEYFEKSGIPVTLDKIGGGKYAIFRNADGKILKGVNFTPPELEPILEGGGKVVSGLDPATEIAPEQKIKTKEAEVGNEH